MDKLQPQGQAKLIELFKLLEIMPVQRLTTFVRNKAELEEDKWIDFYIMEENHPYHYQHYEIHGLSIDFEILKSGTIDIHCYCIGYGQFYKRLSNLDNTETIETYLN